MGAERKNNTPHFAVYSHVLLSAPIVIAHDLCYCCNCCNALFFFFKMQLSVFSICIAVLLSLVTIKVSSKAPEEKKIPKTLPHYCGVKFRKVWEMCCDHGCRHNAYKRVLGEKL